MKLKNTLFALALATTAIFAAAPAHAQENAQEPTPVTAVQTVSLKPINAIFGVYTAEYERVLSENTTVGAIASTFGAGGFRYMSLGGKYRLYMGGTALEGFSIAGTGSVSRIGVDACDYDPYGECTDGSESVAGLGAGVELGYTFRLGEQKNYLVNLAAGAQRIFPLGELDSDGFWFAIPTGGISVGYAF